jgi:dTDP-4-dehydrorhamnose 3,5-epimerase
MEIEDLAVHGAKLIRPRRHGDQRGHFVELFQARRIDDLVGPHAWVQDNMSLSREPGTIRGLHFQLPPFAQAKLVTVLAGALLDVVLDLRPWSPSFRRVIQVPLDAEEGAQLFVPAGCAHGLCTTKPDTLVHYKVSAYYDPASERGILWSDPALGIDWPVRVGRALLSPRDHTWPTLSAFLAAEPDAWPVPPIMAAE